MPHNASFLYVSYSFVPIIVILSIVGLLFQPVLAFALTQEPVEPTQLPSAPQVRLPETLDEAKDLIFQTLKLMPKAFLTAFKEAWSVLEQIVKWLWVQWDKYVWSWIKGLWHDFLGLIGQEFEKRKSLYERELEKQKQEVQQEVHEEVEKAGKSLWERLKELIKSKL